MISIPILISASCVTLYWTTVVIKSIRIARKIGKDPNVLPRERIGQLTRLIWAPTIFIWIILLWQGVFLFPDLMINFPFVLKAIAACSVIIATALTFWCWHQMGRSWRIGMDPGEKTELIVTGPYRYVLHPIYSLSMLIGLGTWITLPTFSLLLIVSIHILMLNIESRREEKYLLTVHGERYLQYQKSVGRLIPIAFLRSLIRL